jgi:hypothetical protein
LEDFWAAEDELDLRIGPNRFTSAGLSLDLQSETLGLRGELAFRGLVSWPVTLLSPGIMGWYGWVPFMETYHGVVSLDHQIEGMLVIEDEVIDFSGGRGYTEKDWGRSFPSAWIWFQSNHFREAGICLTASLAIIPWIGRSFPGLIVGLWYGGQLHRFATYTGAKTETLAIGDEEVVWTVSDRRHRLEMRARRVGGGLLQAPSTEDMDRRIVETLDGEVRVALFSVDGEHTRQLMDDVGRYAGLEAAGDVRRLESMWRNVRDGQDSYS